MINHKNAAYFLSLGALCLPLTPAEMPILAKNSAIQTEAEFAKPRKSGSLEVISGPMCSGKSEELIRRLKLVEHAEQSYVTFISEIGNEGKVISRNGFNMHAQVIKTGQYQDLQQLCQNAEVVAFDEIHFQSNHIVKEIQKLIAAGKRVIVSGLDTDFRGQPFSCMPDLISIADHVKKLKAICQRCKNPASMTERLVDGQTAKANDPLIVWRGAAQVVYQPVCRNCHAIFHELHAEQSQSKQ